MIYQISSDKFTNARLDLGYVGNVGDSIIIDCNPLVNEYEDLDLTFSLIVKPSKGRDSYFPEITRHENLITWELTTMDTTTAGSGYVCLCISYIQNGVEHTNIVKSTANTYVKPIPNAVLSEDNE